MVAVQILAIGLLIHEVLKYCMEGRAHFVTTFCPTFGLRLGPVLAAASHLLLTATCLVLILCPRSCVLHWTLLVAITVVAASYPLRLSNHIVVAWFLCLVLCLAGVFSGLDEPDMAMASFGRQAALVLLVLTYVFAIFHKLNRGYFATNTSCAACYWALYLDDRGITHPLLAKVGGRLSSWGVLVAEVVILALLVMPKSFALAFVLATLLHLCFGLVCFQHFSTVMYSVWVAAAPPTDAPLSFPGLIVLGACIGGTMGAVSGYRHQRLARCVHIVFGGLAMFILQGAVYGLTLSPPRFHSSDGSGQMLAVFLTGALYFLNGAGPYLGIKTEFSLAMFSNLRRDPWDHLCFSSRWRPFDLASYVVVESVEGLPARDECPLSLRTGVQWLNKCDEFMFSTYFLSECLRAFPSLRIICAEEKRPFTGHPRNGLRMNLFPFALPRNSSTPYCK